MQNSNSKGPYKRTSQDHYHSSSGYPGVSWNRRMKSWLAFYYQGGKRKNRTFNPKHYNNSSEGAKLAAISFMKSLPTGGTSKVLKVQDKKSDMTHTATNVPTNPKEVEGPSEIDSEVSKGYNGTKNPLKIIQSVTPAQNYTAIPEIPSPHVYNKLESSENIFFSNEKFEKLPFTLSKSFSDDYDAETRLYKALIKNDKYDPRFGIQDVKLHLL